MVYMYRKCIIYHLYVPILFTVIHFIWLPHIICRLEISQKSPMQETLNLLLLNLDISNIKSVLLELNNQCLSGTGLMTRVAAVQAMCYLTGWLVYISIHITYA